MCPPPLPPPAKHTATKFIIICARTVWTPTQYDSRRVNLSRVINSHAHEPLFINAASGAYYPD